ncbi:hypothetical protein OIU84_007023 [Salix udensis]|uniref:Bromo domain-containing protein n=1 Tax=Salix udensis TaxID=889485 RepID=A0AAD6JZT8_9ROSI|nr:hypothetical protein OIU84_007023 [Salix udensis]
MGEVADPTMKKKKKKGRPSLLELQKRSLKQQQVQQTTPISLKNPNSPNSNPALPNRRSSRRSSNSYAPEWIDGDDDEDDDEDDERKEKKHKLLRGLNSQKNNNQNSNSLSPSSFKGSDSNAGGGNQEDGIRRRKISAVRLGSDDLGEKVLKGTDTIHGSSVEPGPTTPLPDKKLLVFILDRLQKKDTYGVFSEPVDPEELPDYFDIVENPMDFSTVKKKLDEGAYAYLEQFEKDVLLICSNAMLYNPPDTIYFRQARAMQELAKKDFENLRQDSDDSEPQPKVVRRGRPPALGKLKKALERSPIDRVGPEVSSDATLATGGDHSNLSNGYNLRKSSSYKYQPGDAFVRASYSNENYSTLLSEWENEFPASVVKAVMKYGKKPFVLDENKRDTYKHPLGSHEPSILSTFEGEIKQLVVVGLSSEHGYARSLARFAADLGPVVWRIASKKIESVLPTGVEFGPGWVGRK